MKSKPTIAARVLLGIMFFGIGLNGLLRLVPLPQAEGPAAAFMDGLIASRYFFPLLFVTCLLTGAALAIGRYVPLALTVLAPIIVNIAVMHLFVPSSGAEMCLAALVTVLEIFLAWSYRAAFRPLLHARHEIVSVETCRLGERHDRKQALHEAQVL
jgi:hypothetical protein